MSTVSSSPQNFHGSEEIFSSSSSSTTIENSSHRTTLRWTTGVSSLPKISKKNRESEDANFVCEEQRTIGVADGVGSWTKYNIDSGKYSRDLMANCVLALKHEPQGLVNLQGVLNFAYSETKALGSSTACIITLRDKSLRAVNIGDSGFMVIREGHCVYRSPKQQHRFNCPYQLKTGSREDNPSFAEELEVKVENGDVVVAGTDGLFDNMFDCDIEDEVKRGISLGLTAEVIASTLVALASYNSHDKNRWSPFAIEAAAAGIERCGGKVDDITVIVACIIS